MARPRQFDEERALAAVVRAFWESGYEATSTEALCRATGLGRSSIYNTFQGKRELFARALASYAGERTEALVELLAGSGSVREKIRAVLWQAVEPDPEEPAGCFVVNTIVESGVADPEIAERLRRDQDRRLAALRAAFEAGRRAGEIEPAKNPDDLARFVIATVSGMRVLARGGADRGELEAVARTALAAL